MEYFLQESLEREIKLTPGEHFCIPDFPGELLKPQLFTSTYFDTPDFRLVQLSVTLRHTTERNHGLWVLKLPRNHVRLELEIPSNRPTPPEPFCQVLYGVLRKHPLIPIAKLRTRRTGIRVQPMDTPVADVMIDQVAILDDRKVIGRLAEINVKLRSDNEKELSAIEKTLREAGAQDGDPRTKVLQALNLNFSNTSQIAPSSASPTEYLEAIFQNQVLDILRHDPGVRLGKDPEELHHMRVGIRRFRALLLTAKTLLAPEWRASMQTELKRLWAILGTVREYDVLLRDLHREASVLEPSERKNFDRMLTTLEAERTRARTQLMDSLHSDWYLDLLTRLEKAAQKPAFCETSEFSLGSLAEKEFNKLIKSCKLKPKDYSDQRLHQLRIRTKRVRYVAEFALGTTGKHAKQFVRQTKRVQDILGEHQDALVSERTLREFLHTVCDNQSALLAGRIIERLHGRRRQAKVLLPHAWAKLKKRGREAFARHHSN